MSLVSSLFSLLFSLFSLLSALFSLLSQVRRYYTRLLEVGGVQDPSVRYKIVVPENAERFPPHISLTSLLLYSPRCLRRIRRFIKGRDAYISADKIGPEERRLAVLLNVSLLAPEPCVAAQFSLKSGAKRLFAAADVSTAPGAHDIYEVPELIGALSKLIAAYIDVPRWVRVWRERDNNKQKYTKDTHLSRFLFFFSFFFSSNVADFQKTCHLSFLFFQVIKLDDEFDGRGHAFFDTDSLIIVRSLREAHRKHTTREPNYWGRPDVQEGARAQLARELEGRLTTLLTLNRSEIYPNGLSDYLIAMGRCGGVVEAVAGDIRGSPSVNLFISPDGHVQVCWLLVVCLLLFVVCCFVVVNLRH